MRFSLLYRQFEGKCNVKTLQGRVSLSNLCMFNPGGTMAKNASGETIGRLQAVARQSRTELAARLSKHGLYPGQDGVMLALADNDGMTAGELASHLGVRPPTVTKMIGRLAGQGFVARSASKIDGRITHVSLTRAGQDAVSDIRAAISKSEKALLKDLGKKDRKLFHKLLGEILAGSSPRKEDEQ